MSDNLYREFENAAAKIRFQLIVDAVMVNLQDHSEIVKALLIALSSQGLRTAIDDTKIIVAAQSSENSEDLAEQDDPGYLSKLGLNVTKCAQRIAQRIRPDAVGKDIDISKLSARTLMAIAQAIESSAETEDEDIYEVVARLVEQCLKNPNKESSLEMNLREASKIIGSLASRHVKLLAVYTVASTIIQNEFPNFVEDFADENLLKRMNQLLGPICNDLQLSSGDYEYLISKDCLIIPTASKQIEKIHGAIVRIQEDLRAQQQSSWNKRLIVDDLASSKISLGEDSVFGIPTFPDEFWISGLGKFLLSDDFRDFSPTPLGKLIGYFVLEYLSSYTGPFYGFED